MNDGFARLKWRWLDTLMHDARLSPRTRCVGYEIARHINAVSGEAWPSQETMRKNLGFKHASQVKRAVAELRAACYVAVARDSTSRSNTYVPNFDMLRTGPPEVHRTTGGPIKPVEDGTTGGPSRDQKPGLDGGTTGPLSSKDNTQIETVARRGGERPSGDEHPGNIQWLSIKNLLRARLSPAVVRSWFDRAQLVHIDEQGLELRAHTRHARMYIEDNYYDALKEAGRAVVPTLKEVLVLDPINTPQARAAAKA